MLCAVSRAALAQPTPFVGQVMITAFNFCPIGWFEMNGQTLPIANYTALFSLLGTFYGGNGTTNFQLPAALPIFSASGYPLLQCIAYTGVFPSRD